MPFQQNRRPRRKNNQRRRPYKKKQVKRKVPYKSSKGYVAPYAYNVEIRHIDLARGVEEVNMAANTADTDIPKNTTLMMPCAFNSDTDTLHHDGSWITPKWLKSKFRVSFDNIEPDHADSMKGFNLYYVQGVIHSTGNKSGARLDSIANWFTDIKSEVGKQLVNSDMSSDYLEFTQKNRAVRILKRELIKPNRNRSIRKAILTGTAGELFTAPPPVEFSVNHALPNFKQRMTAITGVDSCLNNTYIPFVAFMCDELTANTGTIRIEHNSRFYYTDM